MIETNRTMDMVNLFAFIAVLFYSLRFLFFREISERYSPSTISDRKKIKSPLSSTPREMLSKCSRMLRLLNSWPANPEKLVDNIPNRR